MVYILHIPAFFLTILFCMCFPSNDDLFHALCVEQTWYHVFGYVLTTLTHIQYCRLVYDPQNQM